MMLIVAFVVERSRIIIEVNQRSVIINRLPLLVFLEVGLPVCGDVPSRRRKVTLLMLGYWDEPLFMLTAVNILAITTHHLADDELCLRLTHRISLTNLLQRRWAIHSGYFGRDNAVPLTLQTIRRQECITRVHLTDDLIDG